jgi:outer membrane receptor protein involved in Fe transport
MSSAAVAVALAVTAVTGDQLAQAGVRDIQSLSRTTPGLVVASSGPSDRENLNFVIRGQGIVYGQANQSVVTYFAVLSDIYGSGANSLKPAITVVLCFELWAVAHCLVAMANTRKRLEGKA